MFPNARPEKVAPGGGGGGGEESDTFVFPPDIVCVIYNMG